MSGKQENLKDISNSLNSSRQISKHVYIQVCISPLSYVVICLRSVWVLDDVWFSYLTHFLWAMESFTDIN